MTTMQLLLSVHRRETRRKGIAAIRRQGRIPGVMYGHGTANEVLDIPLLPFQRVWQAAGESTLIDVAIDAEPPVKAIIQDIQYDPATGSILHVDFHQVNMKEKIDVHVELAFVGEAVAVKELGGTLVKDRDSIDVECLPQDLVKSITVDISCLKTFDDVIRVADLSLPQGLTLKTGSEDLVAHVEPPRSEAELAELETAVEEDVSKVEKVEEPKEPEEAVEGAEGKEPQS